MDVVLVVGGGVGDIEVVALAGVPLGIDPVEDKGNLGVDIGPNGLLRPGGIHLAGGHVGDIVLEGDGDVLGRGGRFSQMDRDGLGDDDAGQDGGVRTVGLGRKAAAAVPRKKGVDGNPDHFVGHIFRPGGFGDHFEGGEGNLPRKDLDPLDGDGAVAGFGGHQGTGGIGENGGVIFIQGIDELRGLDLNVGGVAQRVGQAAGGEAVACNHNGDLRHRRGLPRRKALDAQDSSCHRCDAPLQIRVGLPPTLFIRRIR